VAPAKGRNLLPSFCLALRAALAAGLSAASLAHAWGGPAAQIESASGEVRLISPDGTARAPKLGAIVFTGETVVTGRDARAVLRFTDGGHFRLQPETRLRIDNYRYSGRVDGEERSYISLLKGGLRAISGAIGRYGKRNFRLITPAATIGVRGTEYAIRYTSELTASVSEGAIELCNGGGCQTATCGEAVHVPAADSEAVFIAGPAELPPLMR
jgi:hypothetical protein